MPTSRPHNNEPELIRFDWAIKHVLRNKANFDVLEGFLSELLKEPIVIDSLLESESNQENSDNKFNRVDLLVSTSNNEKIIIEVQTVSEWDFYHRILFGTSKIIAEYLKKGQPYSQVPKVISVSVLFFNLGVGSDYVYKGETDFTGIHTQDRLQLSGDNVELYLNKLDKHHHSPSDIFPTYYIIQLKKFANIIQNKFDEWVYFLKNESIKPTFSAQGLLSAKEKLDVLKLSPEKRRAYEKYWQDMSFEASLVETQQLKLEQAGRFGEKRGMQKGMQQGIQLMAKKMFKRGYSIAEIAEDTGLTLNEIENLLKE